ncbi:MAG TPA: PSP1 domain-containing protein, partial [Pirellulales bacterium]|nr:PSP1 domain-containing protein [Pirellulales bacterium]
MPKYVVRFGVTRWLGAFGTSGGETLHRGTRVVARTDRGVEIGEVLCEATEQAMAQITEPRRGQILRTVTGEDEQELSRLIGQQRQEYQICKQKSKELGLDMEVVDVEHLFGGERIVVYYLSESRVDFRELVKVLATEFQA